MRGRGTPRDLLAGLSIAGLLLPEAVAYSRIAGLPPQAGVMGLFAGLAAYGLLGRSRFAIVSATSSSAAVLGAATASLAGGDPALRLELAWALTFATGGLFIVAGLARLGHVTDFIAKPVLRGFAFGLALVIALKQFADMVGVHEPLTAPPLALLEIGAHPLAWNLAGLATGGGALLLLALLARLPKLPSGLIVIALGVAASRWLDLGRLGVPLVGTMHLTLDRPAFARLGETEWLKVIELGVALLLVLYCESYGAIRSFALKHGDPMNANRDLLALGAANVAAALLHGTPVGAGYSATSANEAAGADSRLAGGVAAAALLLLIAAVLPAIALTPEPVLDAIVIRAVSGSLDPRVFGRYFAWRRDRLIATGAVVAVLLLGVLDGLLAAIAISLLMVLRSLSRTAVSELGRLGEGHDFVNIAVHPEARPVAGLLILRPEEPLFFANVDRILGEARERVAVAGPDLTGVVLSLEESFDLDSTSIEALAEFFGAVAASGRRLVLARLKHPVHVLLDGVFPDRSAARIFSGLSVDDAVRMLSAP